MKHHNLTCELGSSETYLFRVTSEDGEVIGIEVWDKRDHRRYATFAEVTCAHASRYSEGGDSPWICDECGETL